MRIARMLVTPELLRALLSLPIATEIIWAAMDPHQGGIVLTVRHPDLRDIDLADEPAPVIRPAFHKQDAIVFVDWGQS
jgi:hypothetical protein